MDCVEGMARLPHQSVDLVFADPPYNLGVDYGGQATDRFRAYIEWCRRWFEEIYRILRPDGSVYLMQYPEVCARWLPYLEGLQLTL